MSIDVSLIEGAPDFIPCLIQASIDRLPGAFGVDLRLIEGFLRFLLHLRRRLARLLLGLFRLGSGVLILAWRAGSESNRTKDQSRYSHVMINARELPNSITLLIKVRRLGKAA